MLFLHVFLSIYISGSKIHPIGFFLRRISITTRLGRARLEISLLFFLLWILDLISGPRESTSDSASRTVAWCSRRLRRGRPLTSSLAPQRTGSSSIHGAGVDGRILGFFLPVERNENCGSVLPAKFCDVFFLVIFSDVLCLFNAPLLAVFRSGPRRARGGRRGDRGGSWAWRRGGISSTVSFFKSSFIGSMTSRRPIPPADSLCRLSGPRWYLTSWDQLNQDLRGIGSKTSPLQGEGIIWEYRINAVGSNILHACCQAKK